MISFKPFFNITLTLPELCPLCDIPHIQSQPLCGYCHSLLTQEILRSSGGYRLVEGIPVYSLFVWKPGESLGIVPEILYSIKGGINKNLIQCLVDLFLIKHAISLGDSVLLVPSPAKKNATVDHAMALLRGFKTHLPNSVEYSPLLRGEGRQKVRDLEERKKSKIHFSRQRIQKYKWFRDRAPVIFVDDVVTSGATVLTAWKALGRPSNFSCWCLADRRRS